MANEIYEYAGMSVTKSSANVVNATVNVTSTLSGDATVQGYMSVPTTLAGTALPITALTSGQCGMIMVRNLDSTNTVTISGSGAGESQFNAAKWADVPAGGFAMFRPPAAVTAVYVRAATAACDIEYAAREI